MRLEGKIAIITGGGSGFGEGIARRFVSEGARVVVAGRDTAALERVAAPLGNNARAIRADVTKEADIAAMVAATIKEFGTLDILVNNAGVPQPPQPCDSVPEELFDNIFAVNAKAIYLAARHVVPIFKKARAGNILNIASTGGVSPRPNLTWYNASKGWAITATRAMAVELAPFGIRVNAINPVAGETPMLKAFMGGTETPEARARFISTIPLGRFSTAEDVANTAAFLCSDEASMITGVALEVDGGRCI